jgi:TPR repeat protein
MYHNGQGVSQDYLEAMKWYRKAADQGYAMAQSNIGGLYIGGNGVTKSFPEAMKWFQMAAEQGNVPAQFNLAISLIAVENKPMDFIQSYKWASIAADQNFQQAITLLDQLKSEMNQEQIAEGERLFHDWKSRHSN